MSSEDNKMLEFNIYQKPENHLLLMHIFDEKLDECKNNSENSSTTNVSEHILLGFSMSTISSFKAEKINMMYTEVRIA